MKKFLIVLTLVLCMALPASAKTWTVSDDSQTEHGIRYAVASADNGDTIVVDGNIVLPAKEYGSEYCGLYIKNGKTLTLQINEGCTITVTANEDGSDEYTAYGIYSPGTSAILTIKGKGSIVVSNDQSDTHNMYGVCVESGTVNIDGGVHISAISNNNNKVAYGVAVFNNTGIVNIDGGASISASSDNKAYGVCVTSAATANILSADINATGAGTKGSFFVAQAGSSLTVYAGTFSDNTAEDYLGPDSTGELNKFGDKYVVTNKAKVTFNPTSLDVAQRSSGVVSVDFRTSNNVPLSIDTVEAFPAVPGITVTSSDGAIKFNVANTCAPGTYTFNVICTAENNSGKQHKQTGEITVTVEETTIQSTLTVTPESATVAKGSSATFTADMKINGESVEITGIKAAELPEGMTCTIEGKTITITTTDTCAVGEHKLTLTATDEYEDTAEAAITVKVTEKSDPEPEPTPSYDVKNGGCNAGFAGLALAAFALLAAKRKK